MKVVVGLGNPGPRYEGTRHNVGFDVVAQLAQRHQADPWKEKFEALVSDIWLDGQKVLLVLPQTYMNRSGRCVGRLADFYQLDLQDLVIVCDDLNLDLGRLRWRGSGSSGGQKGLANIIVHLGTEAFPRQRIGIGRPPGRMDVVSFVLGRLRGEEKDILEHAVQRAADAVECWTRDGLPATMNRFNPDPGPAKS